MILSLNWYKNGIFEGKQRKMIMKKDSLKEFFAFAGYHLSATGQGILLGWLISKWLGIYTYPICFTNYHLDWL